MIQGVTCELSNTDYVIVYFTSPRYGLDRDDVGKNCASQDGTRTAADVAAP